MAIGASQGNVIASAFVRIQPEASGFGPALRQTLATNLLQLEKQNEGFLNKIKGSIGTTAKVFATAGATSLSLFGAAAISSAKDLEKTSNAFKGLFGSVAEGKKQFDAVFKLAEVTPFEGSALAKDFQKFTASYASQGVPLQKASDRSLKILQALADGGSALGATTENISGFALAMTQTVGKGKLTGEEIRQMTNNLSGFNVVAAVANHTGMTTAEVYDQMKKGAISSDIAIEAIVEGLNKIPGAAGASARQLRTVSGALSTVKDIFQRSTFEGLAEPLKVVANTLVDNAEVFRSVFKTMSEELGGLVITASGIFSEVISDFDATFGKLAIGGLEAAGASLYGFKDGLKESFQQLGILGDLLQRNQGYFVLLGRGLGNISVGFSEFFTNIIKGFEPTFKVFSVFFDMFGRGFKDVARVFGPQLERGLFDSGLAIMRLFNNLRESFKNVFDSKVSSEFIKALAGVGRGLFDLVIKPLDALSVKTDGVANGFEKMLKMWTPALKEFQAAITGLANQFADLFTGIDTNALSDFVAGTGKHVIEAFTALAQYGGIFVNIMETLLQVLTPINEAFGNLAEQAGAAFIVFKLTGSPLLTMISLFKDLDTGMIVFFLTLSKVVPLIKQTQAALASLKSSQFIGGLTQITNGIQLLGKTTSGTSLSLSQFVGQLNGTGDIGNRTAGRLLKNLDRNGLSDLNVGFKDNQRILLETANGAKSTRNAVAPLTQEMEKLTLASGRFATTNRGITGILAGLSNGYTKLNIAAQEFGKSSTKINGTASGLDNVSKNAQAASTGMSSTLKPASALAGSLGSIGTIATTLGLGIGISLLTSHLASAAEQASKTKQQIKDMADLSFNYLTASSGQERTQAIAEGVKGIQDRFGDDKKALGTFNALLARNGLSTEQFYRDINKNEKTRVKVVSKLVGNLLDETSKKAKGGDIFESSEKGNRNISAKANKQAISFYKELATIEGASLERGLDLNDAGVRELIAKRTGKSLSEVKKQLKGTGAEINALVKQANVDEIFGTSEKPVQFKKRYSEVAVVLGQISQSAGDAAYKLKESQKALQDSETLAKDAAESYKLFGESQRVALSSSSAFFDKVFEASSPENISRMKSLADTVKKIGIDGTKLVQTKEGRDFLTPFSGFKEAEDAIKTNVNAPVSQTIGLLKKSNEEIIKFGKNIGLSAEEIKKVQIATGDLTYAEDLGAFVEQLSSAGKLGGGNLQAILRESIKLSPADQKTFLDNIPTKEARKTIEDGLKDLKGNVLLDVDPSIFSNLKTALDLAGKGKNLNLDFLNLTGNRSLMARGAIEDLFAAGIPIIKNLNSLLDDGKISVQKYTDGITNSRKQLIESLADETGNIIEARKIFASLGLGNEIAEIKAKFFIDGKPTVEGVTLIKKYLDGFTKEEYPLKLKAQLELDPEQAAKDFAEKARSANKSNKSYAFGGVDSQTLSELSKNMTGTRINLEVIPEIPPAARASYVASLAQLNTGTAAEVLVHLNKKQATEALSLIPTSKQIEMFTSMNPIQLASTLALIPKENRIEILTGMDQAKLAQTLSKLPATSVTNILTNLPASEKGKLLEEIRLINPTLYAQLAVGKDARIAFQAYLDANPFVQNLVFRESGVRTKSSGYAYKSAEGRIVTSPILSWVGEAGNEAIIPMTRPARALQLLKQSGLYDLAVTHSKAGTPSSFSAASIDNRSDNSQKIEVNVDMRGTRTQDPEGMALLFASRLTNGIRR